MRVRILGSGAGGGFPQWNCACRNCNRLRDGTLRGRPRTQTQIAVDLGQDHWCLLNASPDLRSQIEATPDLHPRAPMSENSRVSPIVGVVLTSGDLDHALGLLLLREFQPLQIYATPAVQEITTEENTFFRMLRRVRPQADWYDMVPEKIFQFGPDAQGSSVRLQPIALPGTFPEYVDAERAADLPAAEAVVALEIQSTSSGSRKMIYCPALPEISDQLMARFAACDLLLLDGTFWADDELIRVAGGRRTASRMGHVPIAGREGSLARLQGITRPTKVYIHINNTNPILDEESSEFTQVTTAGWTVAHDGMLFNL
jgi:pyrroloquinoline quinone biosynthesis protein B